VIYSIQVCVHKLWKYDATYYRGLEHSQMVSVESYAH
jgi:hypothetical protein